MKSLRSMIVGFRVSVHHQHVSRLYTLFQVFEDQHGK